MPSADFFNPKFGEIWRAVYHKFTATPLQKKYKFLKARWNILLRRL
jgi:hypothetical protein